ncbi:MAG: MBL fold metallo-hydrolase [Nitrospiraceae bacterium]
MRIRLLRHATLLINAAGTELIVDPLLGAAEAYVPIRNSPNPRRNPLVELPVDEESLEAILAGVQAVMVTHLHSDHWDEAAKEKLDKGLPIFCQPSDTTTIEEAGFMQVLPMGASEVWEGIQISITGGRHGSGELAERLGPVSGFVIRVEGQPSLYIAGDTVWCPEVEEALEKHRPDLVVVNAGAARFVDSDRITMDADDVSHVAQAAPSAQIVAMHMEAINHCLLTREELRKALEQRGLSNRIWIPEDGETREFQLG